MQRDLPPSRTAPQFVVRLPDEEFRTRLAEAAKQNNRSMNSEIVARLESSFVDNALNEMVEVSRVQTEAALRVQIQYLMVQAASLGYGVLLTGEALTAGTTLDEGTKQEIEKVRRDAEAAIEAFRKTQPQQVIDDLQNALLRAANLEHRLHAPRMQPQEPKARIKAASKKR